MLTQRRIQRLKRRITKLEARQESLQNIDDLELRGPLVDWIKHVAKRNDLDLDRDDDGDIDFEDLVDAAVEVADTIIIPGNPLAEFISDIGLDAAGKLAVILYTGRERRVSRRLRRLKKRLARLTSAEAA